MADETDKGTPSAPSADDIAAATLEFGKYLDLQKEELNIKKQRAELSGDYVESLQREFEFKSKIILKLGEQLSKMEEIKQGADSIALGKQLEEIADYANLSAEELAHLDFTILKLKEGFTVSKEELQKLSDILFKTSKRVQQTGSSISGMDRALNSLAGGLNLGLTSSNGFASSLMKLNAEITTAKESSDDFNMSTVYSAIAKQALIGFANKLGTELIRLTQESSKAAAEMNKLAGSTENSMYSVNRLAGGLQGLGLTMADIGKTTGTLMNDTGMLGDSIDAGERSGVKMANMMVKLGVSAKQLTDTTNLLSAGFGMSFDQSMEFYSSMITGSRTAGQSIADVSAAFGQASNRLAMTSTSAAEMEKQFKSLNLTSRELGVQISEVLSLTDKFDKFGDAANMAGKLNAQFGLNLSMTKLQRLSNEERVEYVRKAFMQQGIMVESLGAMEKKFIQSTLGIKDQATMLKLLGSKRKQESANVQKLNELLADQMDAWSELKAGIAEFAMILEPLMGFIWGVTKLLAMLIGGIGELVSAGKNSQSWLAWFTAWGVSIVASFGAVIAVWYALGGAMVSVGSVVPTIMKKLGEGMTAAANGARGFFAVMDPTNIAKFSVMLLAFGAAAGLAGAGMGQLAEAMSNMNSDVAGEFVYAMTVIMVSMLAFVAFMVYGGEIAAVALIGAAAAMLIFAGGVWAVASGVSSIVTDLNTLSAGSFMALIDGLVALGSIESPLAGMAGDLAMIGLVANELDGMVIMQSTGSSSTVMMASENIIKGKTEGSMDVNVKLFWDDKVDVKSQVHVYLDSEEITHKVATRLDEGG